MPSPFCTIVKEGIQHIAFHLFHNFLKYMIAELIEWWFKTVWQYKILSYLCLPLCGFDHSCDFDHAHKWNKFMLVWTGEKLPTTVYCFLLCEQQESRKEVTQYPLMISFLIFLSQKWFIYIRLNNISINLLFIRSVVGGVVMS